MFKDFIIYKLCNDFKKEEGILLLIKCWIRENVMFPVRINKYLYMFCILFIFNFLVIVRLNKNLFLKNIFGTFYFPLLERYSFSFPWTLKCNLSPTSCCNFFTLFTRKLIVYICLSFPVQLKFGKQISIFNYIFNYQCICNDDFQFQMHDYFQNASKWTL